MEKERENKRCSACGGEAVYVRDLRLKDDKPFGCDWMDAALYRCAACGHFDFYEREEDRAYREQEAERRRQYDSMPGYRCPQCGRVGKEEVCPVCLMPCVPVTPPPLQTEEPRREEPEKPKKRRWFGRSSDKPDWEG